ncbi:flagellar export chaperone FlgN [Nocardioides caldifontis]|uniref:flagellar export chaperone FlgN n=1 Tax=Nocardioides caldifontis TaxID=2588938 RepID=UPI0011E049C6|nr:flagellar export chaperone FlgN [Nocardioides caldifontis]
MEDLSLILWRERELLETLLYRLEVEKLVLASGSSRWLATSAREVEQVLDALRETELVRAVAADEAAATIGMASNPSLRALAEAVDEPWRSILLDHREAFVNYMQEITAIAAANRELLTSGQMAARETLLGLTEGGSSTYSHDGSAVAHDPARRLVDQSI